MHRTPYLRIALLCLLLFAGGTGAVSAQIDAMQHRRLAERLVRASEQGEIGGKPVATYLREEKIAFLKGDMAALCHALSDTTAACEVVLADGKRYAMSFFHQEGNPEVVVSYPADYQLILGTTLMEAENRLFSEVWASPMPPTQEGQVVAEILQQMGNGPVYRLTGSSYIIPELNNNRYYVENDSAHFSLLYSEDLPAETMANLVTGTDIDNSLSLDIRLVKYGYRTENATVPLRQWVAFCLSQGCAPYFGVISHETSKMVCELVMHNESLGYAHVMKFELDPSILAAKKGTMTARLNSYVPVSNVKNLFQEYENERKK